MTEFLYDAGAQKRTWSDRAAEQRGIYAALQWTGQGRDPLNVAYGTASTKPTKTDLHVVWKARQNRGAAPVLLAVAYPEHAPTHAVLMGPKGEDPPWREYDLGQAERIATAALAEPSRHQAERFLFATLDREALDLPGLTNRGLLATHELLEGVPGRPDWASAGERARKIVGLRDQDLIRGLGFAIRMEGSAAVLTDAGSEQQRAVAVFLQGGERPDAPSKRHGLQTPVTYALAQADKQNIRWVLTVQGGSLRLYSTATSGAAGQRGRTDTWVELNLPLLADEQAGYLDLLFSAGALAEGGTVDQIREASRDFTAALATRLRERVYDQVVPRLALAIAEREPELPLEDVYRAALTVLFRLLFIAYGEDQQLLPYDPLQPNAYTDRALKTRARRLARQVNAGEDLGFDNPLTAAVEPTSDAVATDLWDDCHNLFTAVREGHTGWGIPPYGGGLFSGDEDVNPSGPVIERVRLANGEFGPAFTALVVDRTPDGDVGPIDFRSLSVREFGTIYEGLLESELARTDTDLALVNRGRDLVYEPAGDGDDVAVSAGGVYLRNSSGARKASGSYFTKPFAVEHLLEHALVPTLLEHLDDVAALVADRPADAARLLFDFRVADIAMGSGHFLTGVVDAMEKHVSAFLAEHELPGVNAELQRLKEAAQAQVGELIEVEQGALLRRLIARRCVYGADVNPISVELARVSMWIHTFVPGLPLSFLDHNLTCGNSLTGVGNVEEIYDSLGIDRTDGVRGFLDAPIEDLLDTTAPHLRRLANIADATTADIEEARAAAREAAVALKPLQSLCDTISLHRVGAADLPTSVSLEDLESDAGRGAHDTSLLDELAPLHFPVAFPEVFSREHPGFDVIVGNPPYKEPVVEELAFWARHAPGLNSLSQQGQNDRIAKLSDRYPELIERLQAERGETERVRASLHAGPYPGMSTGDPDLYKAFCWRFLHLARTGGGMGLVLPRSVFATKGASEWRQALLHRSEVFVTTVRNTREWVFDQVNPGYTFVFLSVTDLHDGAGEIRLAGRYDSRTAMLTGLASSTVTLDVARLEERDDTFALPDLGNDAAADLFRQLLSQPTLGSESRSDFMVRAVREFDVTTDRKKTGILKDNGDTPVYNHLNVGHFTFDPAEGVFTTCDWDEAVAELRRRQRSGVKRARSAFKPMFQARGTAWLDDPDSVPVKTVRIAFRDVVHASNPRKVWAAVLPAGTMLTNPAPYLLFPRGELEEQAWLLAMMNSSVCDWYGHLFVGLHLNYFILYSLPIPEFRPHDPRHQRAVRLAATLAHATGQDLGPWEELQVDVSARSDALAELDALASLAYGLDETHLGLVWGDPAEDLDRPDLDDVIRHRRAWQ